MPAVSGPRLSSGSAKISGACGLPPHLGRSFLDILPSLTAAEARGSGRIPPMAIRTNVGLSRFAQISLAATALAPVLLVWAAASYEASTTWAAIAVIVVVLLVVLSVGLLTLARRELQRDPLTIARAVRLDKEVLGFLVAYALPLVVSDDPTKLAAIAVFILIVGLGTRATPDSARKSAVGDPWVPLL